MALNVADLEATIRLVDNLSPGLKNALKNADQFGQKLGNFGAQATKIGAGLTAGLTLPIAAIGTATLRAAANAVESENLVRESFKGMTEAAVEWSEGVGQAVGSNTYKLRENAASMFLLAKNMGVSQQQAFSMSTSLTELAGDLDSFLNLSEKGIDPIRMLQSGLVGETEALRRLNVFVNQATLQEIAYSHGIAETGEKLTQQQKFLATYIAIMEQTSDAQGDLARTLDSPINQMRVMQNQLTELAIEFGTALLPVLTDVLTILRDSFLPVLKDVVAWFTGLDPTTQKVIVVMAALAAALGPVLIVVGQIAVGLGALIPLLPALGTAVGGATAALGPFAAVIAAIAGGAALGLWLREHSELFRGFTDAVGGAIGSVIEFFRHAEEGRDVTEGWTDAQKESLEQFKAMQQELQKTADETKNTTDAFRDMHEKVVGGSYVPDMMIGIEQEFARLEDVMLGPVRDAVGGVLDHFQGLAEGISGLWGGMLEGLTSMVGSWLGGPLSGLISQGISAIGGFIGGLFHKEEEEVNDIRDRYFSQFENGFVTLQEKLVGTIGAVEREDYVKKIFDAETVAEFEAAVAAVNEVLNSIPTDININTHVSGGGGGGAPTTAPMPDLEAQQGFFSPSMPRGPRPGGGTDLRVHPGERVSVTPAGGGGRAEQPLQVVIHVGSEKLFDMITKATRTGQVRVHTDAVQAFG